MSQSVNQHLFSVCCVISVFPSQLLCSLWFFSFLWLFSSELSHSQASINVCEWKATLISTGSDGTFLCVDICLYRSSGIGLSPTWVWGPGTVWVRFADREQKCSLLPATIAEVRWLSSECGKPQLQRFWFMRCQKSLNSSNCTSKRRGLMGKTWVGISYSKVKPHYHRNIHKSNNNTSCWNAGV